MMHPALAAVKIKVLVFGPDPTSSTRKTKLGKIAKKRIEIRDTIRSHGDLADFPEEVLAATNPMGRAIPNALAQEIILIREYDLVIIIVDSPGTNVELGTLAGRTDLAKKTQSYIDTAYRGGLAHNACQQIKTLGGEAHEFDYPVDIRDCHLLTKVLDLIERTRWAKYLS